MRRTLTLAAIALLTAAPLQAAGVSGHYIEARTCDVWTGPCFANAEMNLGGKHAVLGWKVDKGELDNATLDGLGVVAVVAASDTLGLRQTGAAKAVLIVDSRANDAQHAALVRLGQGAGRRADPERRRRRAVPGRPGHLPLRRQRLRQAERGPGQDRDALPRRQARQGVRQRVGLLSAAGQGREGSRGHRRRAFSFSGKGVNETWSDAGRRGAYLGSFATH